VTTDDINTQSDQTPAPEGRALAGDPDDPPPLRLRGDFAKQIKIIPSTMMNLRLAIGETRDRQPVLVPFVELNMTEQTPESEAPRRTMFEGILTLENAAFLIADLADDFYLACQHYAAVAESSIKPDKARTQITAAFVDAAREKLAECADVLEKVSGNHPEAD
jgi:hypothetical protein